MMKTNASHRGVISRFIALALAVAILAGGSSSAHAQLPEGVEGWTYYINSAVPLGITERPDSACKKDAENHMGTPLLAMQPLDGIVGYECNYSNRLPWVGAHWYGTTVLHCKAGYTPRWPGVCSKGSEPPPPAGCSTGDPGFGCGNPVLIASGAKVQSETDLVAGPFDTLRIDRTYRSLRKNGNAVSAGYGWSFSFDRALSIDRGLFGSALPTVSGTLGDGSYFSFHGRTDGSFASQFDQRLSLQAQGTQYDDWLLTTLSGQVERYKKVNGVLLLVSSHTREGRAQYYSYDTDNKLKLISDANGRSVKISWSGGEVASIEGPYGSVSYEYDQLAVPGQENAIAGMARLVAVHFHDNTGRLLSSRRYHYEDEWQRFLLTGITDENDKRFATYAYNGVGSAVLSEHAEGADRYGFRYPDEATRVVTDPLGTERTFGVTYASDRRGRITGVSQPAGAGSGPAASALTYSVSGDLTSSTDFNGQKTCFVNDQVRGLELARMPGLPAGASCPASGSDLPIKTGRVISTQWHPAWRIKTGVAEPNRITTYVYNGERGADGQVLQCAGDATLPNGKPIAVLCSKTEQATTDNNGTRGFAAARTGPLRVWRYTYNSAGQLLTRTGPADASGNVDSIRLTYFDDTTDTHTKGDLASAANGVGEVTQFLEYGKDGLATRIRRPNGQTITLVYGQRQRLATSTIEDSSGLAETTNYAYDDVGQLTRIVWPDGSAIDYTYDAAHRLTDLRDTAGNTVHLTLDNMGNVIQQEVRGAGGALVALASRIYDALNRLQKEQRDAQDTGIGYAYDRVGNLTAITDPLGHVTSQLFDSFNRVAAQTLPAPASGMPAPVIGYAYTHQDQLLSVIDPRKLTTRYGVDGFGQQNLVVSPDTGTATTQFDAAGNPELRRDANGRTTSYRFDAERRVTQIGSSTFEYGKDGTGATGRMTRMNDGSGQSTYAYDGFGRVLSKTQTVGLGATAKSFTVTYTYGTAGTAGSSVGHVATMTYPSGNRIDIMYGSDGRTASLGVTVSGAGKTTILENIRYVPFGAVQSWTWGNSTATSPNLYERRFDLDGRIVSYPLGHSANNGTVRTLSYDPAGRISASVHSGNPAATLLDQRYDYDSLDRLTGFDGANASQRYQYDASGNRTQVTLGARTYLNTISPGSNRLNSTTGPAPAKRNVYDAAGNLTSDGVIQYSYGNDGRLSGVVASGVATGYRYNGLGQRVAKARAAGVAVHYVYDESGRLLGEYDGAGKAIQETVYLDDLPVAVLKPGAASSVYYVYADHLATARVITRASDNKMVWRWDNADPFGVDQPDENPSKLGAFAYNPRFPGQVFDKETNNHYNYFRDYDPQTGRYIQSDPIGLEGGINTYGYALGNPIRNDDPNGLQVWLAPRLPPRVQQHNRWIDPDRQMVSEFGDDVFTDPFAPLPVFPQKPIPRCHLICASDTPNSCPSASPSGLPMYSSTSEKCVQVCNQPPFAERRVGKPPAMSPDPHVRNASRGDWQRLFGMMKR